MEQRQSRAPAARAVLDPALLAFVKCHVTSPVKWDVLWALAAAVGPWAEPVQLAREINQPTDKVRAALDDLRREGILDVAGAPDAPAYRLPRDQPTSVVVTRLMAQVTRSPDLRRLVVAHMLRTAAGSTAIVAA